MRPNKGAIASWLAVLSYMALIFVLSAISFRLHPKAQKIHLDWLVHVVEYSVLGFLLVRALNRSLPGWGLSAIWATAIAAGVLYAASDEWHQSTVPERDASPYDVTADAAGVTAGAAYWLRRHKKI